MIFTYVASGHKVFNYIQLNIFQVDSGRHDYMKIYSCCMKICAGQNSTEKSFFFI